MSEAKSESSKYNIQIGQAQGPVIGDYAHVEQHFHAIPTISVDYSHLFKNMFKDYTEIFGGRKAELTLLDSWLQDPAKPFGFIHAPAGLGKTALLIHWILHLQSQQICEVVFHLISSPYQTDTEQVTLRNLVGQLASLYQEEPPFSNIALHSSFHL